VRLQRELHELVADMLAGFQCVDKAHSILER